MIATCYKTSLSSNINKVKAEIKNILEFLKIELPGLSEDDLFDLRLVYSELIVNAITHGNKHCAKKKVDLLIEIIDYQIVSVVKDEGDGFDYSVWLKRSGKYANMLEEKGRGLKLVLYIADSVRFNSTGNEITFIKNIRAC